MANDPKTSGGEFDSAVTYNMNHRRRGVALIFNHMRFEKHLGLTDRNGTDTDRDRLIATLGALKFDVRPYNDLTFEELNGILAECGGGGDGNSGAFEDHSDADCLVVCVLSHGDDGHIFANDRAYKPDTLWTHFSHCSSLSGKPKLFFVQACRGDEIDKGITLTPTVATDSVNGNGGIDISTDCLVCYSTVPGYASWRNRSDGSWFIKALCDVLSSERAFTRDLLSNMTAVARRVAVDFQSRTSKSDAGMKQIPCMWSMLTRDVYFTRSLKRTE